MKESIINNKIIKRLFYIILVLLICYIVYKIAIFYIPFLIAFIISMLIEPLIKFIMMKGGLTRKTSAIIIFIIVSLIIATLLIWGIGTFFSESTNILEGINGYLDKGVNLVQNIINNISLDRFPDQILNLIESSSKNILTKVTNWISSFLTSILNILTSLPKLGICFAITIISLYFICVDKIYILDLLEHHIPNKWVRKLEEKIRTIFISLGGYIKAEFKLTLISFIICLLGLYIYKFIGLNINYPLLNALLIGFVDALPILGSRYSYVTMGYIIFIKWRFKTWNINTCFVDYNECYKTIYRA